MELTQLVVQTIAVAAAIIKLTLIFTVMNFGFTNKDGYKNRRQVINLKINGAHPGSSCLLKDRHEGLNFLGKENSYFITFTVNFDNLTEHL